MKDFILVTGAKRSGTTWLGTILSSNGDTAYVHEPFNPMNVKVHGSPIELTYHYVNDAIDMAADYRYSKYIHRFLKPDWKFVVSGLWHYKHLDSRYVLPLGQYRDINRASRKVIKDPCALFSARWMQNLLDCKVVVIVRHPASYVSSMLNKGWYFDPRVFKYQAEHLKDIFKDEWGRSVAKIQFDNYRSDHIGNLILGWRLLHSFISTRSDSEWIVVKHEDLLESTTSKFGELYKQLDLEYTNAVETTINKLKRVSITKQPWKKKLPPEIIDRIKIGTDGIWQNFYKDSDW